MRSVGVKSRVSFGQVFLLLYILAFVIYLIIGLQPVKAYGNTNLIIPQVGLDAETTFVNIEDGELKTPEQKVGVYSHNFNNTFLFAHSTTVFSDLKELQLFDKIYYQNKVYSVKTIDMVSKDKISMKELLAEKDRDTLVLMTCAGTLYSDGDASHRLIITASI